MPVTSVTVEHGLFKLVVSRGLETLDYRIVVVNPRFFREGLVNDPRRVANTLRKTLGELGTDHRRVIAAIPGYQSDLQSLRLPRARGMDPKIVIPQVARRRMGFSPDTSYLAWHRMPDGIDTSNWLVLSATRRSVSSLSTTVRAAGLQVSSMELRSFALARAASQPDAIIAWAAADGCEVSVIRDWVPVAIQEAYWGAEPRVEGNILVNRITEVVERAAVVCEEAYLDSSLPEDAPVYVIGSPLSVDSDVARRVAVAVGRPLKELNPPMRMPPDFPLNDFAVNVGLALAEA